VNLVEIVDLVSREHCSLSLRTLGPIERRKRRSTTYAIS
jgi:hypothetical protein